MIANGNNRTDPKAARARRSAEQGYVLVVFILFATLLMVGLATILPKAVFEGRRDKEEELIFRGMQYRHAIQLFYRKFGRYPNTIEELEKTNGIRFLRKRFKDPMTKNGEWRLIRLGPGGVFVGSLTSPLRTATPGGVPASGSNQSQQGGSGSSPGMSPAGGPQQPGAGQSSGQSSSPGSFSAGGLSGAGTQTGDPTLTPSANPATNSLLQSRASAPGQQPTEGSPSTGDQATSSSSQQTSASQPASNSPILGGGPIAGFASQSKAESIRIWNTYAEYDKWEFIFDIRQDQAAAAMAVQGQSPTQPAPTGQSPSPSGFSAMPGGFSNQPGTSPQFPTTPIPGGFPPPQQR